MVVFVESPAFAAPTMPTAASPAVVVMSLMTPAWIAAPLGMSVGTYGWLGVVATIDAPSLSSSGPLTTRG